MRWAIHDGGRFLCRRHFAVMRMSVLHRKRNFSKLKIETKSVDKQNFAKVQKNSKYQIAIKLWEQYRADPGFSLGRGHRHTWCEYGAGKGGGWLGRWNIHFCQIFQENYGVENIMVRLNPVMPFLRLFQFEGVHRFNQI